MLKKSLTNLFDNPKIKEKINSEQFDLSIKLIRLRLKLDLSFEDMAKIAQQDKKTYMKLEYGDIDIDSSVYTNTIKKIRLYEEEIK